MTECKNDIKWTEMNEQNYINCILYKISKYLITYKNKKYN